MFPVSCVLASWCAQCHEARRHHGWSQPRLCAGGGRGQPSGPGRPEGTEALSAEVSGSGVWCSHLDRPQGGFWCISGNKVRNAALPAALREGLAIPLGTVRAGVGASPALLQWETSGRDGQPTCGTQRNTFVTLPSSSLWSLLSKDKLSGGRRAVLLKPGRGAESRLSLHKTSHQLPQWAWLCCSVHSPGRVFLPGGRQWPPYAEHGHGVVLARDATVLPRGIK